MAMCYVGLLAGWQKCCTKRCLESQDNAAGHMTFVGAANMPARLTTVVNHYVNLFSFSIMCPDLVLVI